MAKRSKVSVITLGCEKNTVDSERLIHQLRLNNMKYTENPEDADTVIINTCGFIDAAREQSVNTILEAVQLKELGTVKKVIVAGCLSERYPNELRDELPEVDAIVGTEKYAEILKELGGELKTELLGERYISTPGATSYIKISEGCDNPCSFCSIPLMRGKHKTKSIEELVQEATFLVKNGGTKELIIIGQDTTDYGKELYGERKLAELLRALSQIEGIEWIRLMYAYPSHFPEDVIDEMANNPKIVKYLDIPLQHIVDDVLRSMRRGITKRRTLEVLQSLRDRIPGIAIRTTFIVGYPAETEEHFNELCEFVKEFKFDRLGVFTFSVEESTPSFILGDPVSAEEKERRKAYLMELQQQISEELNTGFIGKEMKILIDREEGDYYIGRSYRDAPEVDGEVLIPKVGNPILSIGDFYRAEIIDSTEFDLYATIKLNSE